MSITKEQVRLEIVEEMRRARVRNIPVRCMTGSHSYLNEGELGLVSPSEFSGGAGLLRRVECADFDADNYSGYGPLTKVKKAAKADSAGGAD